MKHIVSITPTPLEISEGLPDGGTYWNLSCATTPDWFAAILREDSPLRVAYIQNLHAAVRAIDGVKMISFIGTGDGEFEVSFVTAECDELPREIVDAVDDALDRELYSKTPPITGNGNDI